LRCWTASNVHISRVKQPCLLHTFILTTETATSAETLGNCQRQTLSHPEGLTDSQNSAEKTKKQELYVPVLLVPDEIVYFDIETEANTEKHLPLFNLPL
jgi:hypothetical protein